MGIMGAFALALANLKQVHLNYDRVLATNLAREGIEIVKNVRDSNWLKIDANVDCDGNCRCTVKVFRLGLWVVP